MVGRSISESTPPSAMMPAAVKHCSASVTGSKRSAAAMPSCTRKYSTAAASSTRRSLRAKKGLSAARSASRRPAVHSAVSASSAGRLRSYSGQGESSTLSTVKA